MQFLRDAPGMSSPMGVAVGTITAVTAAAATYYMASRPAPYPTPVDMKNQSIKLPDGSRTSTFAPDGKRLIEYLYEDAKTTYECFQRGLKLSRDKPCLGTRTGPGGKYEWITYQQLHKRVCAFGSGLMDLELEPENTTFVGIYSQNRTEWVITEQACAMFSMPSVALYDTLGPDTCVYIINQTGMTHVVVDTAERTQLLLDRAKEMTSLTCLVVMNEVSKKNKETAEANGVRLVQFSDIEKGGQKSIKEPVPPKPSDVALICYTSGTTGDPKGALLTHANILSNVGAIVYYINKCGVYINNTDSHLSYLPLAHVFERLLQVVMFMNGSSIGFFSGDVKLLTNDMQELKPTIFPTVPRLLNRMFDKVNLGVQDSIVKTALMNWALSSKGQEIKQGIIRNNSIWDTLVFKKIQQLLGGRVKLVFTASAPLEPRVLNFARSAFGCVVLEGYGQTEATAGIAFNLPGETISGHVGPPLPCNIMKLVDVPEMDYYAKDGKGEVCCKGPNVFIGYYKNDEKTKEALDDEGWLHTGDVGQWLENGCLKIIDRKKNIFKLAQGEYIAAEKIENIYMRSQYVAQAFIEGDGFKAYIMGVMVPDEEVLMVWAKQNQVTGSFKELCHRKDVKDMILKDINDIGKRFGLKGFEMVRDIVIFDELFSVENGLLTPTFKNKRPALRKFFKAKVEDLFVKHEG